MADQSGTPEEINGWDADAIIRQATHDIIYAGGKRLLVARPELFAEYDRAQSEAELRDGLILPLPLLTLALALNTRLSVVTAAVWIVGLGVLMRSLWLQARYHDRDAWSINAHAIADGVVTTQTLDLLIEGRRLTEGD
jgi:hypothetical protein